MLTHSKAALANFLLLTYSLILNLWSINQSYRDASATTAAATNANIVASVQVKKKEPSSSSTITYPSSSTSVCHTSLNKMTISMAKYSTPPGSKSFSNMNESLHTPPNSTFYGKVMRITPLAIQFFYSRAW
mmetsp:Transcript_8359/g.12654  ORF Transcript_8359/g.12654 Transcript_8359/m.12654 type:complete len:131 (+) Transcript_8359:33-425(+)